ncbi:MAG: hypothetical protein LBC96_01030 [Lachnospiraceae bacterium]|jgi:hypothetical protein|nr:hypothetical protein [Lachnospiraceae bacterium]
MEKLKVKKFAALLMAGVMIFTLAACDDPEPEPTIPDPVIDIEPPSVPDPDPAPAAVEATVDFEDGNMGFIMMYTAPVNADHSEVSLVSYNGGTALQVRNMNGRAPYIGIDASSILGADIANVASIEMSIGTAYDTGRFSASSGRIVSWVGENLAEVNDPFSVFIPTRNPNIARSTSVEGQFVAGANNIVIVYFNNDVGPSEGNGNATIFIEYIRFLDANGNVLKGDTSVAFDPPAGFDDDGGLDVNLFHLAHALEVAGFSGANGGAWSQVYVELNEEELDMLVPGSMIEVAYASDEPIWLGYNGENGWLRGIDDDYSHSLAYLATGGGVAQWTYEQLVEFWGEGFKETLGELFVEAANDWEVLSLRIGMAQNVSLLGSAVEVAGFSGAGGGGWSQAYVPLSDEEKELLVPGSVIEIAFASEAPPWLGYNGENGWIRAISDDYNYYEGEVGEGVIQWPYEVLVGYWGEGFVDTLDELFVEAWNDWEVLSLRIGKPFQKARGFMAEVAEFAGQSGGGWSQAYIELSEDEKDMLTDGSFITVYYASDEPPWLGYNGENGWLRAISDDYNYNEMTWVDGMVQISYDMMIAYWGEGFTATLETLFIEAWNDWEVMALFIGRS